MFNKTIVMQQPRTEYIPYEKTVIEKRAPTDESVRLLKDLETAAIEKITKVFQIESTIAKGIVLEISENPFKFEKSYTVIFNINGKQHSVEYSFSKMIYEFKEDPSPERAFGKAISDYLMLEILRGIKVKDLQHFGNK